MSPADLRSARKRLGLTQAQLAAALKLKSDRTIRRMEAGGVEIGGPVQVAIALILMLGWTHVSDNLDRAVAAALDSLKERRA